MINTYIIGSGNLHTKAIDWKKLTDLIEEIERTKSFGEFSDGKKTKEGIHIMPTMNEAEVVHKFIDIAYNTGIVYEFDWVLWKEGAELMKNPDSDFKPMDLETLRKLISMAIRADRFVEGYLVACFESVLMLKLLYAVREKIQ